MAHRTINHPREKCLDCWHYKYVRLLGVWMCPFNLDPVFIPVEPGENGQPKLSCVCYGYTEKHKDGKPIEETAPAMRDLHKRVARLLGKKKGK